MDHYSIVFVELWSRDNNYSEIISKLRQKYADKTQQTFC